MDIIEREKSPGTLLDGMRMRFPAERSSGQSWRVMGVDLSMKSMDHAEILSDRVSSEAY
jgi:hypothetical protein